MTNSAFYVRIEVTFACANYWQHTLLETSITFFPRELVFFGSWSNVSRSRIINYCNSCILLRQNPKALFRLSRTELGLTANNFQDSIVCTTSREIYDSRTQVTRPHQATKPSWRMGWIIETPREKERRGERERICACPRFYYPRKVYKLTPLRSEERLTTTPGRATHGASTRN